MNNTNMILTSRGILQVDGARLIFKNFSGLEKPGFNAAGARNFCLVIPDLAIADQLSAMGVNVKVRPPREEGDEPFAFIKVNVRFRPEADPLAYLNPQVWLITGNYRDQLCEGNINRLDRIEIANVDLDVTFSKYTIPGRGEGRSAYLSQMYVTQSEDRFAQRYVDFEVQNSQSVFDDEMPF